MSRPDFNAMSAQFQQALEDAYEQGVRDGAARVMAQIQAVVNAPADVSTDAPRVHSPMTGTWRAGATEIRSEELQKDVEDGSKERAPKGAVQGAIEHVLTRNPGIKTKELRERVAALDERIALKSIDNTLSRGKDTVYRYDDAGRWYLIPQPSIFDQAHDIEPPPGFVKVTPPQTPDSDDVI